MHSTRLLVVWVTLAALTALNPVQAQEEEGTPRRRRRPVAAPETPETPAEPEAPKPETPRPEAPKPEAPKPEAPKPEAPKPEAPKPEAPKPEAPKVEVPKPEAPKPEAPKVEAPKPGTESGDEEGGARRRPPRGRPTPPKPETPKPEAPKPGAPKPEAPKPEAPKPDAPKAEKLPDAAGNEPAPEVEAAPLSPARDSDFNPTGYVGPYQPDNFDEKQNVVPVPNRWMVPFPEWNRYSGFRGEPDSTGLTYEYPFTRGGILDPYQQNILKGDYPIIGNEIFFAMTLISDTVLESRTAPTPRGIASRDAFAEEFFGNGRQDFLAQTFLASFELFRGDTALQAPRLRNSRDAGLQHQRPSPPRVQRRQHRRSR